MDQGFRFGQQNQAQMMGVVEQEDKQDAQFPRSKKGVRREKKLEINSSLPVPD